jgi:CheY-like chemotaxis protein
MATATEKRASVLLVEDEPEISVIAAEALAEQGFDVHTVATASEALRCLSAGGPIDILFTDINLPGDMDGAALAQAARALRPGLPVMYTSGRRHAIEHLNPIEGSMFVAKPYNPFDLGRLLDYLMAAKEITARRQSPVGA